MPPRKKATTGPTPVDAITYNDKRTNLPTADAHDFVDPEIENPFVFKYPRPLYSPQLVWRGKEEQDLAEHLEGNAPPIYIQEKIDPRVLIENLRQTSARPEEEPELTLFDAFDGLPELDLVDFYQHEANWSNRMILGDSLNVMASLAERERLRGKVQMIYLDPPYGIKFGSNWQVSARKRDVKDGKLEDATREVEQIKAFRDTWEYGINSYLTYLRDRLSVAKELLTQSGSLFVQIGDENVHLVRSLMDEVMGSENFVSLITFVTTSGFSQSTALPRNGDYLLWYAKDAQALKVRTLWVNAPDRQTYRWVLLPDGTYRGMTAAELAGSQALPPGTRIYTPGDLQSQGAASEPQPFEHEGKVYRPGANSHWKANYPKGMERLAAAGRLHVAKNSVRYRRFVDDFPYQVRTNLWADTGTGNFTDDKIYVVQTNVKVVERCILLATDPGDLVLDPTCGSGTTAFVAEQWGRRWITVDTSRVSLALARQRIMGGRFPWYLLADSEDGRKKESELSGTPLPRADATGDIRHGFVYERVQRITLGSIANNPDVKEGMEPAQLDAAIRRHAEYELLLDKPFEDSRKVRVAGPFTVESLSPHRSVAFSGSAVDEERATRAAEGSDSQGDAEFEQTVIANLRTAGIQNGRKKERLTFDSIESYASPYIQAVAVREDATDGTPKRVGITVGPQYGTVGPSFIKDAAREANRTRDVDLLCVLAFAFDPAVLGTADDDYVTSEEGFANVAAERRLGRVPVLLVRMNADLVMGEELKKTGAGNLFTVFGEPDIEIKREDDELRVLLHGVDVYDPNTGELRSNDTDQIALWMIDTAYNGESFFVRHCYFTGGQDPYKRLKAALKADIDPDAWASLYGTESRPFARPETGKIAVKVINDYGDEVMKVFTV
ncbi:site-specific DNA-methyltransferase [Micromonospora sp. WMMA1947]|uniref:site-specific DNA-methyltransferase n=1 Tax=Micromonospora sp. WMMA1947 TaxID=3015163 RepID=UPI00248BEB85|nr:site-specific DNA-methyltransferase [Micromonospora sp. WMMA1947]WBC08869.1 site-specific DNA-methyltransferase [Micromonospora sp. WMMA1947]